MSSKRNLLEIQQAEMRRASEAIRRARGLYRTSNGRRRPDSSQLIRPSLQPQSRSASSAHQLNATTHLPTGTSKSTRNLTFGLASAGLVTVMGYFYNGPQDVTYYSTSIQPNEASTQPKIATVLEAAQLQENASAGFVSRKTQYQERESLDFLDPEQITRILRKNEESYHVDRKRGVLRFDLAQVPSNDPVEDNHSEILLKAPAVGNVSSGGDWMFWGIYDGHAGWTTAARLRQALTAYVYTELAAIHKSETTLPTPEAIDQAIKAGFTRLDHDITWSSVDKVMKANSKRVASQTLSPAVSGSCALLSFFDTKTNLLRVACTGDSRAVLGRRMSSGKWSATPLSVDQTADNPDEAARIRTAHPGEDMAVSKGRVLGDLEPSRAFGDALYKWSEETSLNLRKHFFARAPSKHLKTPPYVTAEPVITATKIEPEKRDFLVMASDSLWEMLSNEEVVGLVGRWIEKHETSSPGKAPTQIPLVSKDWSWFSPPALPVEPAPASSAAAAAPPYAGKSPHRPEQWQMTAGVERFVLQDDNVATHLARNALGGSEHDLTAGLLMLPTPNSRRFRDDLTITVVFFGHELDEATQDVAKSPESVSLKAKL